jgi:hypothetical protein
MNKQPFILILLWSIILLPIPADAKSLNDAEVLDLLHNGFVVPTNADEVQVKKQLGQPIQTKTEAVVNPYSDRKDEVTRYIYSGLEITFCECKNPESLWKRIVEIKVTDEKYKLNHGIRVGMSIGVVEKLFKGRDRQSWQSEGFNYGSFSIPNSVHDQVNFAVKNNTVKKVIWSNLP